MHSRQETPNISRQIFFSAIGHVLVIVILILLPSLRAPFFGPIDMVWVDLPRGTSEDIGTGMKESKDLPKSTIQEQKEAMKQKEKKVPEKPKMADPTAKKAAKKPEKKLSADELKMKAALAKINKELKTRTVEPEAAQIGNAGEGYKYGTSDQPLRVQIDDPDYVKYQAMIRARIIQGWIVPMKYGEMGADERPNAKIVVMINNDGDVTSAHWEEKSGDPSFDSSCMRAVQRASPFDVPPERLKWEAYGEGFLVEFDPRLKP